MNIDIADLRQEFIQYLKTHYSYARPEVMASNVLFSYYHDIGMPFGKIFTSDVSMQSAKDLLITHFENIGRKDPKRHAYVHYGCWKKFKEFLEFSGNLPLPDNFKP